MKFSHETNAQAPPRPRITRAKTSSAGETAQPSLTSGFGTVMDDERDLQESTAAYLQLKGGGHSTSLHQVLHDQQLRLGGNIALLEQRYEALPHPERFQGFRGKTAHPAHASPAAVQGVDRLARLIAQHRKLLASIATLMAHCPDGQRGELILAEVARSHEEMARILATWILPGETRQDSASAPPMDAAKAEMAASPGEGNWENEGGPPRTDSVASAVPGGRRSVA